MKKIKKGDDIIVIAGRDKGKKGTVTSVLDEGKKLLIEGINLVKKCVKPNPNTGEQGGITTKSMPIHRSNVMVYDQTKQKGCRVGIRILEDGQRVRYSKASDELIVVNK